MTPVKDIIVEMRAATAEDEALVTKAYAYAENAHKDHKRYSGEPYFVHPAAVAKILAEYGMDSKTIAAGLLERMAVWRSIFSGRKTSSPSRKAM